MSYIQIGKTSYSVDYVSGKTLKELKELYPDRDERLIKALYDELKSQGLTKKKKVEKKVESPKSDSLDD